MSFTNPCATLHNYKNSLLQVSELRADPTLINYANKVYDLSVDH